LRPTDSDETAAQRRPAGRHEPVSWIVQRLGSCLSLSGCDRRDALMENAGGEVGESGLGCPLDLPYQPHETDT